MVDSELTLVSGLGECPPRSGGISRHCAGVGNAHRLENQSWMSARFLEVRSRLQQEDWVRCPDVGFALVQDGLSARDLCTSEAVPLDANDGR